MKASEGSAPGSHAEHDAAPGEVVQQHNAVGQDEGLVVGQGGDARTEADVLGALRGGRNEHLGRGDDLVAGGVVFAEPGLVEAEPVQVLNQLQVALECQRRVLPHRMEGGQEDAEASGGPRASMLVIALRSYGLTRILPCSPGVRSVSKAPGAPSRSTADVMSCAAPGTPTARRARVAANSAGV